MHRTPRLCLPASLTTPFTYFRSVWRRGGNLAQGWSFVARITRSVEKRKPPNTLHLRAIAGPIERLIATRDLQEPGMAWKRVGWRRVPIDGVWTAPELRRLVAGLQEGKEGPDVADLLARGAALGFSVFFRCECSGNRAILQRCSFCTLRA